MNYNVKPIESLEPGRNWYEVTEADNEYHLWIVGHDPLTDNLDCTCEARERCEHRAAVTTEALAADWREDQADRLDYARGQY
jgi:hypothetical protein